MLALKKTSPKKMAIYGVILLILVVATGYMLFSKLFKPSTVTSTPVSNIIPNNSAQDEFYGAGELDFLQSEQFKNLKSFDKNIEIDEDRNNNPFEFSN